MPRKGAHRRQRHRDTPISNPPTSYRRNSREPHQSRNNRRASNTNRRRETRSVRHHHNTRSTEPPTNDAQGSPGSQDLSHPVVNAIYNGLKASATRLGMELEILGHNIQGLAPAEGDMLFTPTRATVVYVPVAHPPDINADPRIAPAMPSLFSTPCNSDVVNVDQEMKLLSNSESGLPHVEVVSADRGVFPAWSSSPMPQRPFSSNAILRNHSQTLSGNCLGIDQMTQNGDSFDHYQSLHHTTSFDPVHRAQQQTDHQSVQALADQPPSPKLNPVALTRRMRRAVDAQDSTQQGQQHPLQTSQPAITTFPITNNPLSTTLNPFATLNSNLDSQSNSNNNNNITTNNFSSHPRSYPDLFAVPQNRLVSISCDDETAQRQRTFAENSRVGNTITDKQCGGHEM